jgi:site-specific DNA-methyltransferase (cytosine-N4-specific)
MPKALKHNRRGHCSQQFLVSLTEKSRRLLIEPRLVHSRVCVGSVLADKLALPMRQILQELRSADLHTRGLALDAIALKLMGLLDVNSVTTHLHGVSTGGAEARWIFQSTRLVFSRWQVVCKNTARVSLDDVAKEVGLARLLKSNVIVVVSTGEIGSSARAYANRVMADSNLCIVLINGADLAAIERNPPTIVDVFQREAAQAMRLKPIEV